MIHSLSSASMSCVMLPGGVVLEVDVSGFPDFCEFQKDTVGRKHRNDQPWNAVPKSLFDPKGSEKRRDRQDQQVDGANRLAVFRVVLRGERRVLIQHAMMIAQIAFSI